MNVCASAPSVFLIVDNATAHANQPIILVAKPFAITADGGWLVATPAVGGLWPRDARTPHPGNRAPDSRWPCACLGMPQHVPMFHDPWRSLKTDSNTENVDIASLVSAATKTY